MNNQEILRIIIEEIRSLAANDTAPAELAEKHLGAEVKLSDLMLDSLGKMSLLAAVEDRAGVMLSEGDLMSVKTLGDLANIVAESFLSAN